MLGFDIYTKNSIPTWHTDHALADDMTTINASLAMITPLKGFKYNMTFLISGHISSSILHKQNNEY